jgi:hypothetical protein
LDNFEFVCNSCKEKEEDLARETPPPVLPQAKKVQNLAKDEESSGGKRKRPIEEEEEEDANDADEKEKVVATAVQVSKMGKVDDKGKHSVPPSKSGSETKDTKKKAASETPPSPVNPKPSTQEKSKKDGQGRKKGAKIEDESTSGSGSDEGGDDWIFDCVCGKSGKNFDDGSKMVACEKCDVWQHVSCNSLNRKSLGSLVFVCRKCLRFGI